MLQVRCNGQIRKDRKSQDQKGADTHSPAEANVGNKMLHHKREHHAAQRGTSDDEATGDAALLPEPCLRLF